MTVKAAENESRLGADIRRLLRGLARHDGQK